MRCVTPMFRRYEQGNYKKGVIVPRSEVMQGLIQNPNNIRFALNKINYQNHMKGNGLIYETIPCGHCYACRLNYSAEWATRILVECKKYTHNYFVTLTYDDKHLPIAQEIKIGDVIYENEGQEEWQEGTVWEPHMHKFLHDLRRYLKTEYNHIGLKYYYCMEYGSETHRPHAHIILMNCPLNLKKFYDWHMDDRYKWHWKSPELEKHWKYGIIDCAEVEWSCAAYVARYCMKKIHSKNNYEYAKEGKLPEFVRMSRNLGRDYYEQNKHKIYEYDEVIMRTIKGNIGSFKPPKAWDRLFKKEHPEQWENIQKSRREASKRNEQILQGLTDYTDSESLQIRYELVTKKGNMLPRVGEW